MSDTIVVVPCFNEAARLDRDAIRGFVSKQSRVKLLLVDDGSTDRTGELLRELAERDPERISTLSLTPNGGKAEAVRAGMLAAVEENPAYTGYWDADLATPLAAIPDFVDLLDRRRELAVVFGARVKLLGRNVERLLWRHYLGRFSATAISLVLGLPVYDTQCGAKLFRSGADLRQLLAEPFESRWIFDVELIARLKQQRADAATAIYEYPLEHWREVSGSKVRLGDYPRALAELFRIWRRYR